MKCIKCGEEAEAALRTVDGHICPDCVQLMLKAAVQMKQALIARPLYGQGFEDAVVWDNESRNPALTAAKEAGIGETNP